MRVSKDFKVTSSKQRRNMRLEMYMLAPGKRKIQNRLRPATVLQNEVDSINTNLQRQLLLQTSFSSIDDVDALIKKLCASVKV